ARAASGDAMTTTPDEERSAALLELIQAQAEAQKKDCMTVCALVAVLIHAAIKVDTASRAEARKAQMAFINAEASWHAELKGAVARRELLVREVATLGPANSTPAVMQWTESSAADPPGYVAALVVLKADARRWLAGLGIPQPPPLQDAGEAAQQQPAPAKETGEKRQQRRYQMCLDAGLVMPRDDYAHLPRGIGSLAEREGITRQAFAEDVKAHIRRMNH
ncbi:MAG: hypothetical protein ACKOWZ_04410, partial [Sediminibacterium sp.]